MKKRGRRPLPQSVVDEFEALIRDTDLPADECGRRVGHSAASRKLHAITARHRRYIAAGRWVDRTTGQLRPIGLCTQVCAASKTGMSQKTIQRRVKQGLVSPTAAVSYSLLSHFSPTDIDTLKEYGTNPPEAIAVLTLEEVMTIRNRAASGESHADIARDYPVSRRQISRIVSGERWGKRTSQKGGSDEA